jgi:hypothetical protein
MFQRFMLTALLLAGALGVLTATPPGAYADGRPHGNHRPNPHGPRHESHGYRHDSRVHRPNDHYHGYYSNYNNIPYNKFWKLVAEGKIPRP